MQPAASVVVPAYNAEGWVVRAVLSVLHGTLEDFEVIVVDDGSTDETAALVEEIQDSRVRLITLETNSGVHVARNVGMDAARSAILAFLDADDELLPTALAEAVDALDPTGPNRAGVMYACGLTDEGDLSGPAVTEPRFLTFDELLCGDAFRAVKGAFAAATKQAIGETRWVLPGLDSLFWRRVHARTTTYAVPSVLMRYHTGTPGSLTDQRRSRARAFRLAEASSEAYEAFLDAFEERLLRACPESYARYLWALGTTSMLSGRKEASRRAVSTLRRLGYTRRAAMLALGRRLPPRVVRYQYLRLRVPTAP